MWSQKLLQLATDQQVRKSLPTRYVASTAAILGPISLLKEVFPDMKRPGTPNAVAILPFRVTHLLKAPRSLFYSISGQLCNHSTLAGRSLSSSVRPLEEKSASLRGEGYHNQDANILASLLKSPQVPHLLPGRGGKACPRG
jgi:hypothetical protein